MIYSIDSFPGRTLLSNGKKYLYFGGTSYLGLQTDAEFQDLFIKNLKKYGTNYGASRKSNIQISIFEKTENYLANLVDSEDCTTLSSGYLAGQLVAQTLNTSEHVFFYAPETHTAVQIRNTKTFQSFDTLNIAVRKHLNSEKSIPIVFMDSIITSVDGYPDFDGLKELPLQDIILVIDDSHGIGILGKKGEGSYKKAMALEPKELIVCCSLGKGFGIQAGAIFGTKDRINSFTNSDFFGGASPAMPAGLATLLEGELIFQKKRKVLSQNINLFLNALNDKKKLRYQENYPVFYFSDLKLNSNLEQNEVLVTNFNYPNQDSPLMSRIVLSAAHTKDDINILAGIINNT